jgi:hypothetical protein
MPRLLTFARFSPKVDAAVTQAGTAAWAQVPDTKLTQGPGKESAMKTTIAGLSLIVAALSGWWQQCQHPPWPPTSR